MGFHTMLTGVLRKTGLMRFVTWVMNKVLGVKKQWLLYRGKAPVNEIYGSRYFEAEEEMTEPTANRVVEILLQRWPAKSVADVGCGTGVYLSEFAKVGVQVLGVDGSQNAINHSHVPRESMLHWDLTTPLDRDDTHEMVICFEVGEHLPQEHAHTLVSNIVSLAQRGCQIIFSAAQPGQGGYDHINEQPSSYWIDLFEQCNCRYQDDETRSLREELDQKECVWWLVKNILVFTAPQ